MPAEIRSFPMGTLNHYRARNLADRIAGVITKNHEGDESLSKIAQELNIHGSAIGQAQDRELGNEVSVAIRFSESSRDDLVKGFFHGVEYNQKHFSQERRDQADTLSTILKKQNSRIHDEPDAVETLMINTLLTDLKTAQAVEAMTALDLAEYPELIEKENNRFVELTNKRAEMESEKDLPLIRPTRLLLHQSLRTMKEYLTLLNRTTPAKYGATVEEINQHITEVVALAKSEKSSVTAE